MTTQNVILKIGNISLTSFIPKLDGLLGVITTKKSMPIRATIIPIKKNKDLKSFEVNSDTRVSK